MNAFLFMNGNKSLEHDMNDQERVQKSKYGYMEANTSLGKA